MYEKLSSYTRDEIDYHERQLELSGFFIGIQRVLRGSYYIQDLSPAGHQFVNEIRDNKTWSKTKEIATKVGNFSIDALMTVASNVASDLLSRSLGLK